MWSQRDFEAETLRAAPAASGAHLALKGYQTPLPSLLLCNNFFHKEQEDNKIVTHAIVKKGHYAWPGFFVLSYLVQEAKETSPKAC